MTNHKPKYTLFPLAADVIDPDLPTGLIVEVNDKIWAWNLFDNEPDAIAAVQMIERFFDVGTGAEPALDNSAADVAEMLREIYGAKKPADESAGNSELTQFEKKKVNNFTQIVSNRAGIVNGKGGVCE